ncbi:MAG: hypothetical protein V4508_01240 [Pseudomonadota bacterium]
MKPSRYDVIELRRYTVADGARQQFSRCFESWFPEAFQQLGAMVFGHFLERERADHFTWLRGFRDMDAHAAVKQQFYAGPVWAEHRAVINQMILDSDNVLLLRPLHADSDLAPLAAVDPVAEPLGAQGVVVAQILKLAGGRAAQATRAAEACFQRYHGHGVVEAAILVTLDEPNNYPQHPVRSDGNYLVWLGVLRDDAALDALRPQMGVAGVELAAAGLLDGAAELLVLDPGRRSRLRWMPAQVAATRPLAAALSD